MKKPSFATLHKYHYSANTRHGARFMTGSDVYREIGYDMQELMMQDISFVSTCALRMSVALLKSGVPISGRLKVRAGTLKGQSIEPGAKRLADQLSRPELFGKPMLINPKIALQTLSGKKGVVYFHKLRGATGAHIDLIQVDNAAAVCGTACYLSAQEIWFWPLD